MQDWSQGKLMSPEGWCPHRSGSKACQAHRALWVATCSSQSCCSLCETRASTGQKTQQAGTQLDPGQSLLLWYIYYLCHSLSSIFSNDQILKPQQGTNRISSPAGNALYSICKPLSSKFWFLQALHSTW